MLRKSIQNIERLTRTPGPVDHDKLERLHNDADTTSNVQSHRR